MEDRVTDIFIGLVYLSIIILRAFNVITWSWWFIFSPFWVSFLLGLAFTVLFLIIGIPIIIYSHIKEHKNERY